LKIGLIGNMNNNNFALMRYFRDLGADAHLLLYANDGVGSLSHFTPAADTWLPERWAPFIHHTAIANAPVAAFDMPVSTVLDGWAALSRRLGWQADAVRPSSRRQLRGTYRGYDRLVASGTSPATLLRTGRVLDVFYPYAMGVEYLGTYEFTAKFRESWPRRMLYRALQRRQLRGIAGARHVICTDREVTGAVLEQFGIPSIQKAIPMVYNREPLPVDPPTAVLARASEALAGAGITLLHHARLMWKQAPAFSEQEHRLSTKNSDWLIRAFADLVRLRPALRPRLFIVEYGPDVDATRELVSALGIQDSVTWLPTMARRELMWLLSRVTIGAGEFMNPDGIIWGGTGWETLASGKPLLQAFRFSSGEFEAAYSCPPPPMLPVRTEADVRAHLLWAADEPARLAEIGAGARDWFETHNGLALARQWLTLVTAASPTTRRGVS
jgi:glycosyltransferase involved in cell wall biosynthesis